MDGAFAEYMIADARESSKVPDRVSFETAAPLACAGVTVWRGVLQVDLKAGETVALVGAGGGGPWSSRMPVREGSWVTGCWDRCSG